MKVQRHRKPLSLVLLFAALASGSNAAFAMQPFAPLSAVSSSIQDEDAKPDKRPEIKEALAELKGFISNKKGEHDLDAMELIDKRLITEFAQSGPRDRKSIVKAVSACLKVHRKTSKEGVRDNKLYVAAATALGEMGPECVKDLQSWINHKTHRSDMPLQRTLILSLGKVKDEKSIEFISDLLTHRKAEVQAASAEALNNYGDQLEKVRKDIFEEVLKVLAGAKGSMDQDINDNEARERYDAISGSMITTLQTMSAQDIRDPREWQTWWNKNKRKKWDEDA